MSTRAIETIQRRLIALGYDPGPADNVEGPRTSAAARRFKERNDLKGTDYLGPVTLGLLFSDRALREEKLTTTGDLPWIAQARKYIGLKEVPGKKHNPRIVEWWKAIGAGWFKDDETPWCGGFVGGVLKEAGYPILSGALAPRALAWQDYGKPVPPNTYGAIVTFKRTGGGHVGFAVGRDERGRLMVLGGNQDNAVGIDPFDRAVTSWRFPSTAKLDTRPLPLLNSQGRPASRNEA